MAHRIVLSFSALAGKGGELCEAYQPRCREVMQEPGCQQFEVFQSVLDPDRLVLLELWESDDALEAHRVVNASRPVVRPDLRAGSGMREDYDYAGRPR
jgi:quinol monooxygenase YgiN